MSRPCRPEPVAVIGKRPVPLPLQNLHHRLLDQPIQHRRDAKLSHPSVRLGDFHPPHRFRLVSPVQQLYPDGWPMLFQIGRDSADGHPIDACTTFIRLDSPHCFFQVFSLTYFLHQSIPENAGAAEGTTHSRVCGSDRQSDGICPALTWGSTNWQWGGHDEIHRAVGLPRELGRIPLDEIGATGLRPGSRSGNRV